MKIFTKKGITQKIILVVILMTLCNFMFPIRSRADFGGLLFDPIANLVMSIGDVIVGALQTFFYDGSFTDTVSTIFGDYNQIPEMKYTGTNTINIDANKFSANGWDKFWSTLTDSLYEVPTIQYSIDKIFAGKVPAFDINFINPSAYTGHGAGTDVHIASQISNTVAKWYISLRNFAVVILLSVLVYIGIRVVISSSADDRAKYKQRIMDWVVAMCLIFFMHYIMNFTISMVGILNDSIGQNISTISVSISDGTQFDTDLMGLVRLEAQYGDFASKVTFMIFYIALVVYTVKFSWVYLKRVITMMFLTVIAPLVAMTYPIDKMNDGKAQAFNAWLKEYIFTALLQPFHLIVYAVLVGSAIDIVKTNPLFAILVIAFIGPAEKMLRKFFGFDKASTPGTLSQAGAMFGGAAAWNMLKKGIGAVAAHKGSGGNGGSSGNGGGNNVRTIAENSNAPDSYGDYGRALAASSRSGNENNTQRNSTQSQNSDDDYSDRAFLPPDGYTQPQDPDDWDNNDMYLNPQNYSSDFANGTSESNTAEDMHRQAEATADRMAETNNNRGFWQKAGAVAVAPARGAIRSFKNTWSTRYADGKWKRTLGSGAARVGKGALKFAGRAAVAGTVGAIGVGMGIAGDDLDDVLKYGAAGGVLGYTTAPVVGRNIANRVANTDLAKSISGETAKAIYGSEEKAKLAKQESELRQSGRMRQFAMENFTGKDGNAPSGKELAALEDRAIELYQNGFTDNKEIKRVMKLDDRMMKELNGSLPEEDIKRRSEVIGKMARDIKPEKLSNEEYVNEKIGEFTKGFKNANFSEKEARNSAIDMMNNIKKYYKKP